MSLRQAIPRSIVWKSFFIKDSLINARKSLVDKINKESLAQIAISLEQDYSYLPASDSETDSEGMYDATEWSDADSGESPLASLRDAIGTSKTARDSAYGALMSSAHAKNSTTSSNPAKRQGSRFRIFSSSRGLWPSNDERRSTSFETSPLLPNDEDPASREDVEFKTHAPPKPILLGVSKGEALKKLHVVWDGSFPTSSLKNKTDLRRDMERLLASPSSASPGIARSLASVARTADVHSTYEGIQSSLRQSIRVPSLFSQDPMEEEEQEENHEVYDNRRKSRGSMASYISSSAHSYVTANESVQSSGEENANERAEVDHSVSDNQDILDLTTEESYETADNVFNTSSDSGSSARAPSPNSPPPTSSALNTVPSTPVGVSHDYESTIRPEYPRWTSNGNYVQIEEEPEAVFNMVMGNWGPPSPDELFDFSDFEDALQQGSSPEPTRTARRRKPRKVSVRDRRSQLQGRIDRLEGLSTRQYTHRKPGDSHLRKYLERKQKGEIVRAEKLLVFVKESNSKAALSDFNETETAETRVLDRWKEYVVVARNTGDQYAPLSLQFYTTRNIPKVSADRGGANVDFKLASDMQVKFYSSLDKTIALWKPTEKGSLIYIFRARSHETSLRWLALFRRALGVQQTPTLSLGVPDLGISVDVTLPWTQIYREQAKHNAIPKNKQLISYQDMKSSLYRAPPVLSYIYAAAIQSISGISHLKGEMAQLIRGEKMGLAWRRYDRLEWVDEGNEEGIYCNWVLRKTHDLELRKKKPYPTEVTFEDGSMMQEPVPVEGCLVRLTRWAGTKSRYKKPHDLDKLFYKKLYFHTHDNLLFFSQPSKAVPPHPTSGHQCEVPCNDELATGPLAYEIAPYRTNENGGIEWLEGNSNEEEIKRHDRAALYEIQRRVSLLIAADGFIDLCEIDCVRSVERDLDGVDSKMGTERNDSIKMCFATDTNDVGEITSFEDSSVFEIVMLSGLVIRLQAYNEHTKDLWILKLNELVKYWKHRVYEDVARINEVRQANLERLHVDEDVEPFVGEAHPRWETAFGVADPSVFHISRIARSRSISMRGILYQKATRHTSFRRFYVILCHGHLILYTVYYRSPKGDVKHWADHRLFQTIPLDNCYVYSGPITQSDLKVGRESWFDRSNPGSNAIPRVYPDGWKSAEDESYRCFVLWFGKKTQLAQDADKGVKFVNKLGVHGTPMTFLTRSRQERDLWVLALNNEIERVVDTATQDINLTT